MAGEEEEEGGGERECGDSLGLDPIEEVVLVLLHGGTGGEDGI